MAKINVCIPDDVLAELETLAHETGLSRSGLVAEATARYVTSVKAERAERERAERIKDAMGRARDLAETVGSFDPVPLIRADRDGDHEEDTAESKLT